MNNLETLKTTQTISSREVADMMEVRHDNLLNKIRKHTKNLTEVNDLKIKVVDLWRESNYIDSKGEPRDEYQVTKKGCEFLAHKTTGKKGDLFTIRYMNKFEEMEVTINNQQLISQEMNAKMDKVIDDANYLKSVVHIKKLDTTIYSKHIKRYLGIHNINEDKVGYGTIRDMFFLEMGVTKFEDIEVNKDNLLILEQCCRDYKKPWEQLSFNI